MTVGRGDLQPCLPADGNPARNSTVRSIRRSWRAISQRRVRLSGLAGDRRRGASIGCPDLSAGASQANGREPSSQSSGSLGSITGRRKNSRLKNPAAPEGNSADQNEVAAAADRIGIHEIVRLAAAGAKA